MSQQLSERIKTSIAITPTAGVAGTTDINGATLDMQFYDGVLITVIFGAITAGAVTSIKAQQGAASDLSDVADLLGTGQTVADTDDDKVFQIDVKSPQERYVRVLIDRATQNAVVAGAIYQQYQSRSRPPTQGSNVALERFLSPAEGTA
jgi:hypothetical protein